MKTIYIHLRPDQPRRFDVTHMDTQGKAGIKGKIAEGWEIALQTKDTVFFRRPDGSHRSLLNNQNFPLFNKSADPPNIIEELNRSFPQSTPENRPSERKLGALLESLEPRWLSNPRQDNKETYFKNLRVIVIDPDLHPL